MYCPSHCQDKLITFVIVRWNQQLNMCSVISEVGYCAHCCSLLSIGFLVALDLKWTKTGATMPFTDSQTVVHAVNFNYVNTFLSVFTGFVCIEVLHWIL